MQPWLDRYCRVLGWGCVLALGLMVVLVFGNVVLRYGFNSGIALSEELSRWLFVWMIFMGAIIAVRERTHLGTDVVVSRLSARNRHWARRVSTLVAALLCGLMLVGSWQQTRINLGSLSAVMEVPTGWLYASGVLFSASALVILLWQAFAPERAETSGSGAPGKADGASE